MLSYIKYISTTQALIVSTFFAGFGGGVVFPILPTLGTVLGISPFFVGLILSAHRFARLVANAPAGSLVDRLGTRGPLIIGLFIEGIATLGYVAALHFPLPEVWFLGARITWGVGSALIFAAAYTIASDISDGSSRGTNMGIVGGGMSFGFPAGLVVGGIISDLATVSVAFSFAAGLALIAGVLAYTTIPETHISGQQRNIKPWEVDTSSLVLAIGAMNFGLFFAYYGALFATLVLFLELNEVYILDLNARGSSGILMAVTILSGSIWMASSGKISDVLEHRLPILLVFLSIFTTGFIILAGTDGLLEAISACALIGAGYGGTNGPMLALLADLVPEERVGRALGTNNVLGDIGGGLGPIISLPLVQSMGIPSLYMVCAVISISTGGILLSGIYAKTGTINPRSGSKTEAVVADE